MNSLPAASLPGNTGTHSLDPSLSNYLLISISVETLSDIGGLQWASGGVLNASINSFVSVTLQVLVSFLCFSFKGMAVSV